jgi:hypothetical protein
MHDELSVVETASHNRGSERSKSPARVAAELLGLFIAMSLTFGGIMHVVTSPEVVAAATSGALECSHGAASASDSN